MMELPDETTKAWMASFVDGEGCISINKNRARVDYRDEGRRYGVKRCRYELLPAYAPTVIISNTNMAAFDMFIQYYGSTIKQRKKQARAKQSYVWVCPAKSIKRLLQDIAPYLHLKRQQAELILEFLGDTPRTQGRPRRTDYELSQAEWYYQRIRECNQKGDGNLDASKFERAIEPNNGIKQLKLFRKHD